MSASAPQSSPPAIAISVSPPVRQRRIDSVRDSLLEMDSRPLAASNRTIRSIDDQDNEPLLSHRRVKWTFGNSNPLQGLGMKARSNTLAFHDVAPDDLS